MSATNDVFTTSSVAYVAISIIVEAHIEVRVSLHERSGYVVMDGGQGRGAGSQCLTEAGLKAAERERERERECHLS